MIDLITALLNSEPGKYAGDEVLKEGDKTVPPADAPPTPSKVAPSLNEINQWNKYLAFFNDKVKKDGVTDEVLDTGDGTYAQKSWDEFAAQNKISSPYDETTKKMQDYYASLYNSKDPLASALLKTTYPKEQLSNVDGRVGSLTRNYFIPTMNYAKTIKDKMGDNTYSFKGVFDPYSEQGLNVVQNNMLNDDRKPMSNNDVINFYKEYAAEKGPRMQIKKSQK